MAAREGAAFAWTRSKAQPAQQAKQETSDVGPEARGAARGAPLVVSANGKSYSHDVRSPTLLRTRLCPKQVALRATTGEKGCPTPSSVREVWGLSTSGCCTRRDSLASGHSQERDTAKCK
jgi:hypothetical protein